MSQDALRHIFKCTTVEMPGHSERIAFKTRFKEVSGNRSNSVFVQHNVPNAVLERHSRSLDVFGTCFERFPDMSMTSVFKVFFAIWKCPGISSEMHLQRQLHMAYTDVPQPTSLHSEVAAELGDIHIRRFWLPGGGAGRSGERHLEVAALCFLSTTPRPRTG
jgi:hypothetical protein